MSANLWPTTDEDHERAQAEGHLLIDFIGEDFDDEAAGQTDRLTFAKR